MSNEDTSYSDVQKKVIEKISDTWPDFSFKSWTKEDTLFVKVSDGSESPDLAVLGFLKSRKNAAIWWAREAFLKNGIEGDNASKIMRELNAGKSQGEEKISQETLDTIQKLKTHLTLVDSLLQNKD